MHYVIDGVILEIAKTENFSSGFKKREIIIKTDEEQQELKIDFVQDSVEKLDLFKIGEAVMIAFTIICNKYQDKYFTNLRGIAIGERIIENGEKKGSSRVKK